MNEVPVLITAAPGFEPVYAKPGDAGADLRSTTAVTIAAGERSLVPPVFLLHYPLASLV